mgnify:CR=1 FL=1|tara:strand:- start:55 stop:456 length:402 start_codon:yes stop_codon:yes gene_type:complete
MATVRTSRGFKDISLSFKPHPITKDMPVLMNERAIARSVRNLVETIPRERFFNALLGTNIRGSLFENYTQSTSIVIRDQITTTIENFEPRVGNVKTIVNGKPDLNAFEVTIFFDIVGLERPRQQFTFILEPTR